MEFLSEYGMFLLKAVTIVMALLFAFGGLVSIASKQKQDKGELDISSISDKLEELEYKAKATVFSKEQFKSWEKAQKKLSKEKDKKSKEGEIEAKLYVLDFNGSMDAKEVDSLRQEVTALLTVAADSDEVLVRLESPGGAVHGYGLAASQLARIKNRGLKLTIAVDKVAASGGYLMACVADKIISAPFAYIGSIGVIAQMPNFNKVLKNNNVEWEQHTAGEFKRTLTMFGENTDEARVKFKAELEEIHHYFKSHIQEFRSVVDIDKVATGEHWIGKKALELDLVDEIQTSDDYLLAQVKDKEIFSIKYKPRKKLADKLADAASMTMKNTLTELGNWRQSVFR
ncbi:protease SohB [Planctobacterium marinum]|uniref:protease SohB n=1 Tax=Planctobacterium marinum TaxID=1631968 RepID=UPI001E33CFC1|nr:protease SohB [Planctobacterium marinum]MCC2604206.1 protease SohB [Planctobacterium marinum]